MPMKPILTLGCQLLQQQEILMNKGVQFVLCKQEFHLFAQTFQSPIHRQRVRMRQGVFNFGADFLNRFVDRCIRGLLGNRAIMKLMNSGKPVQQLKLIIRFLKIRTHRIRMQPFVQNPR